MANLIKVKNKIRSFNKVITVSGDKSISIRWVLFSSLANGVSTARNLLISDDVLATLKAIKTLGIKYTLKDNECKIFGKGIDGYNYKKKLIINAYNSGTLGRLILGLIINTLNPIKLIGDKSLSKRDFKRISDPLSKFGANFKLRNNNKLPLFIHGTKTLKPINFREKRGSAQCKSAVIFAGMRTNGVTTIRAKKSRNHTEVLCKHLNLPINVKSKKNHDLITIKKVNKIKSLNYNIPSDISSSSFFIILTALSKNSELKIRNININPSRIGVVKILKKMGVKIYFEKKKIYKGEEIADIRVKNTTKLKAINCPQKFNSQAIDEFLVIFLVAAKAKGISYFKNLEELNQKESPRLIWASKILSKMGVKNITTKNSIKIFGNPNLKIKKKIIIKNFLKDHRVFMTSVVAALSFGGSWEIHDKDSIKTSFPDFLNIINKLKND